MWWWSNWSAHRIQRSHLPRPHLTLLSLIIASLNWVEQLKTPTVWMLRCILYFYNLFQCNKEFFHFDRFCNTWLNFDTSPLTLLVLRASISTRCYNSEWPGWVLIGEIRPAAYPARPSIHQTIQSKTRHYQERRLRAKPSPIYTQPRAARYIRNRGTLCTI